MRRLLKIALVALAVLVPSAAKAQVDTQFFTRIGVGMGSLMDGGRRTDFRALADLVGDCRTVFPGIFLVSVPAGFGNRGYKGYWDNSGNYLWARNAFVGLRPGIHIGYTYRLDIMGGVFVSYDLWGREFYRGSTYALRDVEGYRRFDYGWNVCASVVLSSFEVYFEYRRGLHPMFNSRSACSAVMCFGVGFDF